MRHSTLWRRTNHAAPELVERGGITTIRAAFGWEFRRLLRDGYRIEADSGERFVVTRGEDAIECWIEAEPVKPRPPNRN